MKPLHPLLALAATFAALSVHAAPSFNIERIESISKDTVPHGLNDLGDVVGYHYFYENGYTSAAAAAYVNGTVYAPLLSGPDLNGSAEDINNLGQIVGSRYYGVERKRGYLYQNGQATDLGDFLPDSINDLGAMVGQVERGAYSPHPAFYLNGELHVLEHNETQFTGINNQGQVVGWYNDRNRIQRTGLYGTENAVGFIYSGGELHTLGHWSGVSTRPNAINDAGHIVGWAVTYDEATGETLTRPVPFLYAEGQLYNINDLLPAGAVMAEALDIDSQGRILLTGSDSRGWGYFIASPNLVSAVPEASTTLMMGSALALMLARVRRVRRTG